MMVRREIRRTLSGVVLWVTKRRQARGMVRKRKLVKANMRTP